MSSKLINAMRRHSDRAELWPQQAEVLRKAIEQAKADGHPDLVGRMVTITPPTAEEILKWKDRAHRHSSARRARMRAATYEPVSRSEIIRRDESTCYLCGKDVPEQEIHIDHIVPLARGGSHTADNLGVTCARCNVRKGANLTDKRPSALGGTVDRPES